MQESFASITKLNMSHIYKFYGDKIKKDLEPGEKDVGIFRYLCLYCAEKGLKGNTHEILLHKV